MASLRQQTTGTGEAGSRARSRRSETSRHADEADGARIRFRGDPAPLGPDTLQLLACGSMLSSVLYAALDLGVFDELEREPASPTVLGERLAASSEGVSRLLSALSALGLVQPGDDGTVRNHPLTSAVLVSGASASIVPLLAYQRDHAASLFGRLPVALRTGEPQISHWAFASGAPSGDPYAELDRCPEEYERMLTAMDIASRGVGRAIAEDVDLSRVERLVDLGGGGGQVAIELAEALPHLRIDLVETPFARDCAHERVRRAGLAERIRCVAGDLRADFAAGVEPAGAVLLSGVISDFGASQRRTILCNAASLLPEGGLLLVSETLFNGQRNGPLLPALLSLFMLLSTGGDNFTPRQMEAMLVEGGFSDIRFVFNGAKGLRDLVVAERRSWPGQTGSRE
jgi:predicted O-methyltransferase YrrM